MTTKQKIVALVSLSYFNTFEHERRSAWSKACELLDRHGLGCEDLGAQAAGWCAELIRLFGGGPQRKDAGYSYTPPPPPRDSKGMGGQAPRDKTHVRQGDVERDVADKRWTARTCDYCGATFGYESYPGNPRRYCSEGCKEAKVREQARWRMRDKRWRAKRDS